MVGEPAHADDDAADGAGAVDAGHRATDDFDALDIGHATQGVAQRREILVFPIAPQNDDRLAANTTAQTGERRHRAEIETGTERRAIAAEHHDAHTLFRLQPLASRGERPTLRWLPSPEGFQLVRAVLREKIGLVFGVVDDAGRLEPAVEIPLFAGSAFGWRIDRKSVV